MKTTLMNDGEAMPDGRFGALIDFEDGRPGGPQRVYAVSGKALTLKLAAMAGNSQARVTELKREQAAAKQNDSNLHANGSQPAVETPRNVEMDPATRMQRTAELGNPATSGKAAAALIEAEIGMPLEKIREVVKRDEDRSRREETQRMAQERAEMFRQWGDETPSFPQHPTNRALLVNQAVIRANGIQNVTRAILDETFAELEDQGLLIPAESEQRQQTTTQDLTPSGEASRRGATSVRRQDLTGARPGQQTTRWTDEKLAITTRNTAEHERLIKSDASYVRAVNEWVARLQRRAG